MADRRKNWGGTVTENGETIDYNGGVVSENVAVRNGDLVLTGRGDLYEGEQKGINRDGSQRSDGKRCGGAIATREYYASGSYEIRAKIVPVLGCCSAMWTFEYEEDYSGDDVKITNHEIDIEFPEEIITMISVSVTHSAPPGSQRRTIKQNL